MSTPLSDIYNIFLSQVGLDILAELEQDVAEEIMLDYLVCAITDFDICKKDLTISADAIVSDLTLEEKMILAKSMILYWLQPKKLKEDTLRNAITDGDYNKKSSANLLDKLIKLDEHTKADIKRRLYRYSFRGKNING